MLACASDSLLVMVDVQERLAAAMDPAIFGAVLRNARILLAAAARLEVPAVATEQYPKGLGRTVAELATVMAESLRIEKTCFSCAASDTFAEAVEKAGRSQIVLAGMEAHVCVLQTALELRTRGREVFVVEDACCSRRIEHHANAMQRMRAAGVVVTNTESVLFEWMRDARHEHFKAISALVR